MTAAPPAWGSGDDEVRIVLPEGTGVPASVPAHIFAAAVDTFSSGQRLDMRSLAGRTGVAYAIVRVSEGFLYADVIADRMPDIGRAVTVIEALLRGLDLVHRAPATH